MKSTVNDPNLIDHSSLHAPNWSRAHGSLPGGRGIWAATAAWLVWPFKESDGDDPRHLDPVSRSHG